MNWVLVILSLAVMLLAVGVLACLRVVWLSKADHAKCIAHIASVTSNRVVANAFREAADRADSVEGISDLRRIASTVWLDNGPTVVALWLVEQAEIIEGDL